MTAEVFLDANILLYACSAAPADALKQRLAEQLILNTRFGLSSQVFQEFIANALRKKALGITEAGIDAALDSRGPSRTHVRDRQSSVYGTWMDHQLPDQKALAQ